MDVLKSKELFFGCLKLYSDTRFDVVVYSTANDPQNRPQMILDSK